MWFYEMRAGAGRSRTNEMTVVVVADMSGGIILPLESQASLSVKTTIGDTNDLSILITVRTTTDKNVAYFEAARTNTL